MRDMPVGTIHCFAGPKADHEQRIDLEQVRLLTPLIRAEVCHENIHR